MKQKGSIVLELMAVVIAVVVAWWLAGVLFPDRVGLYITDNPGAVFTILFVAIVAYYLFRTRRRR